ncbi:amidase [Candidatus Sulfidibacterium hydrothermale]|uniref:amidase n=1 Tax=Candidatus Sulfidibacterium hydrothermale TaxID=2875962 RepID=UPI0021D431F5|nr:amidase [Candidatus Sulfidibacterium hydrothermale]UBM62976.1 amidase [Candidatus Sulfidibacterium hydrothermale]
MKKISFFISVFFLASLFFLVSCNRTEKQSGTTSKSPCPTCGNMGLPLNEMTISEMEQGYHNQRFTVKEVVRTYLLRIKALDQNGPHLNAFITVNPDAMKIADSLDKLLAEGKASGPLFGIPVVLKDNIDTHDKMACTAGSRALAGSHPLHDSWVAARLRAAGAIIIGKANLSEWANFRCSFSSSGWSGMGGQTKNPYVLDRNPCGSSSGPGVAVSANLAMVGIGTETDGSIVCPSSANGIVGIKPTVGLISRTGVIPISFTQDTPGPMTRTVSDAATLLGVLTGVDSADSKTFASKGHAYRDYTQFLKKGVLRGKRIGLYMAPMGIDYKVDTLMYRAVRFLESQGATVVKINKIMQPGTEAASFQVLLYEFKDGLNKYLKTLGPDAPVKTLQDIIAFNQSDSIELKYFDQKLMLEAEAKGNLNSPGYKKALKKMTTGSRKNGMDKVMNRYHLDAIIAPTGAPAWKTDLVNGDHFVLGSSSPAAISGYPSITVPMGFIQGLPVGISFFGRAWSEPLLIGMAYDFEQGTHHRDVPTFKKSVENE